MRGPGSFESLSVSADGFDLPNADHFVLVTLVLPYLGRSCEREAGCVDKMV
jgi:hypothetical protein